MTKAAKSKDSEVKLADATLLVRQEIERMKGKGTGSAKDGDKKAAGSKSEKSAEPSKKKAAAKSTKKANKSGVSDRFVVDLRSGESSQAGS